MRVLFITTLLIILCLHAVSQENRQIRSRQISQLTTRTEQLQKGIREVSFITTQYDTKGRETEVKEFNADSTCIRMETFRYNRKGREIFREITDSLTHKHIQTLSTYDKWNRITEKVLSENNIVQERTVYSYNTFDDKIEEKVVDGAGNLKKISRFEYDSRSMLTRKTTTNSQGEIVYDKVYRYQY